ncbi:MAG TPA: hypothetical protein VFK35_10750 [Candidatus Limnocylindrales bacterium]|nr:hypothetical protein [Candidatus Limnocylindrales bacterium]
MRPSRSVAGAALTAALALGALPGIAGSAGPSPASFVDPSAFQSVQVPAFATTDLPVGPLDAAHRAAGALEPDTLLTEPGSEPVRVVPGRPRVSVPAARGGSAQKPPRFTLRGEASFYDNGTTAMRLPRGTTVIICGAGGCIERIINDYGPTTTAGGGGRIVDLYRPDFFAICGCGWWSGTTQVTVSVY